MPCDWSPRCFPAKTPNLRDFSSSYLAVVEDSHVELSQKRLDCSPEHFAERGTSRIDHEGDMGVDVTQTISVTTSTSEHTVSGYRSDHMRNAVASLQGEDSVLCDFMFHGKIMSKKYRTSCHKIPRPSHRVRVAMFLSQNMSWWKWPQCSGRQSFGSVVLLETAK